MYKSYFKRIIDLFVSIIVLLLIIPFFLIITISLFIINRGNPFFLQKRPGLNGHIFKVVKFKTMTDERDKDGEFLPDNQRITKIGRFIRSTSLDEIPQLINVLRGEMSLIGPRPLLVQYLPLYSEEQSRRHLVRPGITGWAQVNGRNAIGWQKKFKYDVFYVNNISFMFDLKIIFFTMIKVLKRDGINTETGNSMEVFNGN